MEHTYYLFIKRYSNNNLDNPLKQLSSSLQTL